jgi:8-oxo-dGTP pyrophosphatase MutT (NUDIX family)
MELLDVYDDQGKKTGRKIKRGDKTEILNEHEHMAVGVIFIQNNKGEFLIQKTSKEKGGEYSSTGGHIDSGETPIESIKREVLEELGVNIYNDVIEDLGFILYDMPLRYLFYINKDIDIKDIKVQEEEVDYVKYMNIDEIKALIENGEMLKSHGILFNELLKKKKMI